MFEERKLKNGIRVVCDDMRHMNSIALSVYVGVGSRYENEKTNGAAHFIEHMLFKGTPSRTAADIACQMDELGGQMNAFTTKEYTCFYFKVLSEHFDKALDILTDMLLNSKFDEGNIKRERTVIDEEISIYEDTPEDIVFDSLQYEVWGRQNLGLEILGTHKSISPFDRAFLTEYLKNNYRTDNIVISVAGKFERNALFDRLEAAFGSLAPVSYRNEFTKALYSPKRVETHKDIEQLHLCLAFPSIAFSDENYTLSVLNTAAGGGMSSRLFQKIREEKGLCYSVYSTFSSYTDTGIFMVYCGLSPSNCGEVIKLCKDELFNLREKGLPTDELNRIKGQIKSGFLLQDESTSSRCSKMGRSRLLRGYNPTNDEMLEILDRVDEKAVKALAEEIFDFDKMSISLVGRLEETDLSE